MRPKSFLHYEDWRIMSYNSEHIQLSLKPVSAMQDLSGSSLHSEGNFPGVFNKGIFLS